jgi:hypothetical protein
MSLPASLRALGLVVALGLPVRNVYRRRELRSKLDWPWLRRSLLQNWAIVAGFALLVGVAGAPEDLGLRVPSVDVLVDGLLFGFVAFAGTMVLVGLLLRFRGGLTTSASSLVVFEQPLSSRLFVAATAAVTESVLFYGFAIEAVYGLGGGPWLAGTVAATGTLLSRSWRGADLLIQWLPGAVVLAGVAVWSRTLLVVVPIYFAYNALVLASGDADDYAVPEDG